MHHKVDIKSATTTSSTAGTATMLGKVAAATSGNTNTAMESVKSDNTVTTSTNA